MRPVPDVVVTISHTDLVDGLAEVMAEEPEVGFIPRVRFERLVFLSTDTMTVAGTGRWFQHMVGSFTEPDVDLRATVPEDGWVLDGTTLRVGHVSMERAEQAAFLGRPRRSESTANREGWGRMIARMLARIDLPTGADPEVEWGIGSVVYRAGAMTVTLVAP